MTNSLQDFWFSKNCDHSLIGRLSLTKKFLILGLFLIGGLCFESKAEPRDLVFLEWTEIDPTATGEEAEALRKLTLELRPIDLAASGFLKVQRYLDELNERLTNAANRGGETIGSYRIFLAAPPDGLENAQINKFKLPGTTIYTGYVFITLPLLALWVEQNLNKGMPDLTKNELDTFLLAVQGVTAHEVAPPIQDAKVKWKMRESRDRSSENHGLTDEAATGAIATELL